MTRWIVRFTNYDGEQQATWSFSRLMDARAAKHDVFERWSSGKPDYYRNSLDDAYRISLIPLRVIQIERAEEGS